MNEQQQKAFDKLYGQIKNNTAAKAALADLVYEYERPARSTRLASIVASNYARVAVKIEPLVTGYAPAIVRDMVRQAFFEGIRSSTDIAAARQKWPDLPQHGGYHDNGRR